MENNTKTPIITLLNGEILFKYPAPKKQAIKTIITIIKIAVFCFAFIFSSII